MPSLASIRCSGRKALTSLADSSSARLTESEFRVPRARLSGNERDSRSGNRVNYAGAVVKRGFSDVSLRLQSIDSAVNPLQRSA